MGNGVEIDSVTEYSAWLSEVASSAKSEEDVKQIIGERVAGDFNHNVRKICISVFWDEDPNFRSIVVMVFLEDGSDFTISARGYAK
jgi:hypothetical protein